MAVFTVIGQVPGQAHMQANFANRSDADTMHQRLAIHVRNLWGDLETVLHPSRKRLLLLGLFTLLGHPLFYLLWTQAISQTYENLIVRATLAISGLVFFCQTQHQDRPNAWMRIYYGWNCWLQLPVFFVWMYWMNSASAMWMATVAIMVVVYFHLTDWRLASLGLITGGLLGSVLAWFMLDTWPTPDAVHAIVFAFALFSAFLLAISSASLRRERLGHSLAVIGIMAHELRTPVATASLIAQALRNAADRKERVEQLSRRLDELARVIHHHIDSQMMNARLMSLPSSTELISASSLVKQVLRDYPFNSSRDSLCVELIEHGDFWFMGSNRQFVQVLNNLIKNALYALKQAQAKLSKGDLRIVIGTRGTTGRIEITDRGVGIDEVAMRSIFEPFFSTSSETGHGLGLAYCRQVVMQVGGCLKVSSKPMHGTTFNLELRCQPAPSAPL
jgi:two-component system, CAI-1 autoinducer sensor kinase/phosphatase CqsS